MYIYTNDSASSMADSGWFGIETHHEIDRRSAAKDMSRRYYGSTTTKPFRRLRVVERSSLGIKLHIPRVDTRTVDPAESQWVQKTPARVD